MARKRVTADELSWIVQQDLETDMPLSRTVALAVILDERLGWRVLIPKVDGRNSWTSKVSKRLPELERRLRKKYALRG